MEEEVKESDQDRVMTSIGDNCTELKKFYDICFNAWFKNEFLKGSSEMNKCEGLFNRYQDCIKKAISEKGITVSDIEQPILGTEDEKQPPDQR